MIIPAADTRKSALGILGRNLSVSHPPKESRCQARHHQNGSEHCLGARWWLTTEAEILGDPKTDPGDANVIAAWARVLKVKERTRKIAR
jgi:hypothetical protein